MRRKVDYTFEKTGDKIIMKKDLDLLRSKLEDMPAESLGILREQINNTYDRKCGARRELPIPGAGYTGSGELDIEGKHKNLMGKTMHLLYRLSQGDQGAVEKLREIGVIKANALQEDTDSEGGYITPSGYIPQVLSIRDAGLAIEPLCRTVGMTSKTTTFPNLATDISAAWTAEEGTMTESSPVLSSITLTAKKVGAWITVSNELIEDSSPEVIQWLDELFTGAVQYEVDNQILNGTGDPVSGLLTAVCGYSVITSGANFSSLTASNLSEMMAQLKARVAANGVYVMHPSVFHYVRTLVDDNNHPIYSPIGGQQVGTIYGKKVVLSDAAPSTSASGTAFVLFGNFQYYLLGSRIGLGMSVDPYGLFTKNQSRIRWIRRLAPTIGRADAFVRLMTS